MDLKLATELISNTKERAEHIMLVDLERNDLGKVCDWGTVKVEELLTIEKYSHVIHLVSNIIGTLKAECDSIDLIKSVFPGGTITGCPKVRCLEINRRIRTSSTQFILWFLRLFGCEGKSGFKYPDSNSFI